MTAHLIEPNWLKFRLSSRRIPPLHKKFPYISINVLCVCVCVCVCVQPQGFRVCSSFFSSFALASAPHGTGLAQLRHPALHIIHSLCHIVWYIFGSAILLYSSIFLYCSTVNLPFCPLLLRARYNSHMQ